MANYVKSGDIPNESEFRSDRDLWRSSLAQDSRLRSDAIALQIRAEEHHYTYQHEWLGVPIIRLPDDIVLQQEIVNHLRPSCIIETGVARGGSLLLSASLMAINSLTPAVLGLDLLIMPHAKAAIHNSNFVDSISLWEGDSSSKIAHDEVATFLANHPTNEPVLLVLDSDHSENHVLNELINFSDLLPVGSTVMVADTIIEEFPEGHYKDRPWDRGNNPLTALRKFLQADTRFEPVDKWNRRSLLSEFRDGIVEKVRP
jgi:cephalosporin hydroxylase